jgi:outer membrane biosynthesis protein TonB
MKSASRTLVKSQPELWQLIDQPDRMQGLMSALLGRATEVTVDEREPESVLRWEAAGDGEEAWIEVELAEKGWGTHVEVSAESPTEPTRLEGWLDAVLDELSTPTKRPFEGMSETSSEPPAPAAPIETPPTEAPPTEETPPVETPPAETPAPPNDTPEAETPPAETSPPRPAKKKRRRRFFGF